MNVSSSFSKPMSVNPALSERADVTLRADIENVRGPFE
jgi:hypothetical protein